MVVPQFGSSHCHVLDPSRHNTVTPAVIFDDHICYVASTVSLKVVYDVQHSTASIDSLLPMIAYHGRDLSRSVWCRLGPANFDNWSKGSHTGVNPCHISMRWSGSETAGVGVQAPSDEEWGWLATLILLVDES
jgi:hypothetical protein